MKVLKAGLFALALAVLAAPAGAQSYPNKPIHIIAPFPPGTGVDIIARVIAERLNAAFGQPVVVENRPGAGGTIGAAQVAKSAPDGLTLLVQSSAHTVNPSIYPTLSYDTLGDFAGVTTLVVLPNALVMSPERGIKSVAELVAYGKANPGKLNYASAGTGSATHMNAEKFRVAAGFEAVHVPYKGTPEAMTDIIGGRMDYIFAPMAAALPMIEGDKLIALAVGSATRSPRLPNVPTTVEAGVPGSDYNFWVGMLAPKKTPADIIARLNAETVKALDAPATKERLSSIGAQAWLMTPAQFDAHIKNEIVEIAKLVKAANIQAN
jgi:tripartite-type tricarboxylate transporter receptor subunit TctC